MKETLEKQGVKNSSMIGKKLMNEETIKYEIKKKKANYRFCSHNKAILAIFFCSFRCP